MDTDESSTSTSLQLTPYTKSSKCQICSKPAHGRHHGALTCRACCVFFRRSAGVAHKWKCIKDDGCEMNKNGFLCKKCRLEKCYKIGMTEHNFQSERESLLDNKKAVPKSLENFLGRPHIVIRCEPRTSQSRRVFLDLSSLVERGSNILSKTHKTSNNDETSSLYKLTNHMTKMRNLNIHGNEVYEKIDKKFCLMFWVIDFCLTAEWLSCFDEFQELPISLKMEFLKSIWYLRISIDRIALTCRKLTEKNWPIFYVALDNNNAINLKKLEYDFSWCTDYEPDQIRYFTDTFQDPSQFKGIAELMLELKPTDVEVTFMTLQICFRHAGRRLQGDILRISENLLEKVSNQMHHYYSEVRKMPNYAGRLAKLMKCDRFIQEFIMNRKQKVEIAQIFDIFNLQFSHPEMFAFNIF